MEAFKQAMARKELEQQNPHKRLHNIIFILAAILLTGQVLEGAFLIPGLAVYYGWPTITLTEVCSEISKIAYQDEDRYCEFPYPLFKWEPEPWGQKSVDDKFPPAQPPNAKFERLGFREVLKVREERMARKAAQAEAAAQSETPAASQATNTKDASSTADDNSAIASGEMVAEEIAAGEIQ